MTKKNTFQHLLYEEFKAKW